MAAQSVPGFSLLVNRLDYTRRRLAKVRTDLGIPTPKRRLPRLPKNWPPAQWKCDVRPINDSAEAVAQWFRWAIESLKVILKNDRQRPNSYFAKAGNKYVHDAYLLRRHLQKANRWPDTITSPTRMPDLASAEALADVEDIRDAFMRPKEAPAASAVKSDGKPKRKRGGQLKYDAKADAKLVELARRIGVKKVASSEGIKPIEVERAKDRHRKRMKKRRGMNQDCERVNR